METKNFKPLIILVAVFGILLIVLLIINNLSPSNNNSPKENESDIDYPIINKSAEDILSKVYNSNRDYYSGFTNSNNETENIFGNEKELSSSKLDQKTKLSIALNNFNYDDLEKINCNTISWDNNWTDKCGSNNNYAYSIPVIELNNMVEEVFNTRIDYSMIDISNLVIGTCTGNNKNYKFRYIKEQSLYVSVKNDSSCINNGTLEVTDVEKDQSKDLLTLIVSYKKTPVTYLGNRVSYGTSKSYQDKFFYKVTPNGTYYFIGSTIYKTN